MVFGECKQENSSHHHKFHLNAHDIRNVHYNRQGKETILLITHL